MTKSQGLTAVAVALLPVLFACNKASDTASDSGAAGIDAASATTAAAGSASAAGQDAAPAAASASAALPAIAAHGGCGAHQTNFFGTGGTTLCETSCSTDNDCKLPATCWGNGNLRNTDGTQGAAEKYCRAPPPDNVCPAHETAFYGKGGKPGCEVFCTTDADCSSKPGTTCKNAGQLLDGDGKMGPAHHYCFK